VPDRNLRVAGKIFLALAVLLLLAGNATAYVGPGSGLDLIGYFMSLTAMATVIFSSIVLWPIYAVLRRIRRGKNPLKDAPPSENLPEAPGETRGVGQ